MPNRRINKETLVYASRLVSFTLIRSMICHKLNSEKRGGKMKTYEIIGLRDEKQAERISKRIVEAVGESINIKLDFKSKQLTLSEEVDVYMLLIISSFEQVSFIDIETMKSISTNEIHKDEHGHSHDSSRGDNAERNMFVVFLLNLFFSIAEFILGTLFKSQAILSDAVHDLGDALSIGLAYFFEKISSRDSTTQYSYGYRRFSLLGGLVTSVILIGGAGIMIVNTVPKLINPSPINQSGVFWVAIGAIVINGFSVWLMSGGKSSNEKLLNIHLFEDLFGWILVLVMSIILHYTDWYILDPILSLGIASWILYVTVPEFWRISKIFLQAVPDDIDTESLHHKMKAIDGIQMISHFHIWSTDGQQHMMSLTLTTGLKEAREQERVKQAIREIVIEYGISHLTIEMLYDPENLIKSDERKE